MIPTSTAEPAEIRIVLHKSPFNPEREVHFVPAAEKSLDQILRDLDRAKLLDPNSDSKVSAVIGDRTYPLEEFGSVVPNAGDTVVIMIEPGFFLIPFLVLAAGAIGATGTAGALAAIGTWAATTAVGMIVSTVVNLAVMYGVNLLLGSVMAPKQGSVNGGRSTSRAFGVDGSRNTLAPYEPVPFIAGQWRFTPPLAARSFQQIAGDDQFLHQLFCWGTAPLDVRDLQIGEAPLSSYNEVETEWLTTSGINDTLQLYPTALIEDSVGFLLRDEWSKTAATSEFITRRTSSTKCRRLTDVFFFPNGLWTADLKGNQGPVTFHLTSEYRLAGSSGVWKTLVDQNIKEQKYKQFWRTYSADVIEGQYDVRTRIYRVATAPEVYPRDRGGTGNNVSARMTDVQWVSIQSLEHEPVVTVSGVVLMAMRIRATEQLNGEVEQLNGLVTSCFPSCTAGNVTTSGLPNRNPARIALATLRDERINAKPIPEDRIDFPAFQEFEGWCDDHDYTCDHPFDYMPNSVDQAFNVVAQCGRGSLAENGDKKSVIWDDTDKTPMGLITARNSSNFSCTQVFPEEVHGWQVSFPNADNNYKPDETIVYVPGYDSSNATKFERIDQLQGETEHDKVVRRVRYQVGQNFFRSEIVSVSVGFDVLNYRRGDCYGLNHDQMLLGLGSARIASLNTDGSHNILGITVDDQFTLTSGTSYAVKVAVNGYPTISGTYAVQNPAGVGQTVTTGTLTFTTPLLPNTIAADDLAAFGTSTNISDDFIIVGIQGSPDFGADLTLQRLAPELETYVNGVIPPFVPNVSTQAGLGNLPPVPPKVVSVQGRIASPTDPTLSVSAVVIPGTSVSGTYATTAKYKCQWRTNSTDPEQVPGNWNTLPEKNANTGPIEFPVDTESEIDFRVWSISPNDVPSLLPTTTTQAVIVGNIAALTGLDYEATFTDDALGSVSVLRASWTCPDGEDVVGYIFRWRKDGGDKTTKTILGRPTTTFDVVPASTGEYFLEAACVGIDLQRSVFSQLDVDFVPDVPISRERITGLEIQNQGNDFEFAGQDIKLAWRVSSSTNPDPLENGTFGADAGKQHPSFSDYLIRALDPTTIELLREDHAQDPSYVYPFAMNAEDGLRRRLRFDVYMRDRNGNLSHGESITINNPVPSLSTTPPTVASGVGVFYVAVDPSAANQDSDFTGWRVDVGNTPTFAPQGTILGQGTYVADSPSSPIAVPTQGLTAPMYYRYAPFDRFGRDPAQLQFSDAVQIPTQFLKLSDIDTGSLFAPVIVTGSPAQLATSVFTEITGARGTLTQCSSRSVVNLISIVEGTSTLVTVGGTDLLYIRIERGSGASPSSWTTVYQSNGTTIPTNGSAATAQISTGDTPGAGTWTYRVLMAYDNSGDTDSTVTVNTFRLELDRKES